jgi:hypothetical protein
VTDVSGGPQQPVASNLLYHPSGGLASSLAGNGITQTIGYDSHQRPASIVAGPSGSVLSLGYPLYDNVGNVQTITDSRTGCGQSYTYDAVDWP